MKSCPTCKKTYEDDGINFCLEDGATLLKKRTVPKANSSRTNEVVAVALLAFSVLVFLCLVSFDQSDPTFNTASSQKVRNWIGIVGAKVRTAGAGCSACCVTSAIAVGASKGARPVAATNSVTPSA